MERRADEGDNREQRMGAPSGPADHAQGVSRAHQVQERADAKLRVRHPMVPHT